MREPYAGIMANYNFTADDMTGIGLSSFVFSKLVNGQFTRTPFRIAK
jgi:branched-chain amino acid transport system substrate-binding protein